MDDALGERFEEHRPHLRAVAHRILGSSSEAEDAVQEAWLRISSSDTDDVENLRAWLTTVVARVSLNLLRSRSRRPEDSFETEQVDQPVSDADPEGEAVLVDSVGLALLVVLDSLTPAERLAFVLHDMFDLPFAEIGPILDRSPAAARQLASRARRRVRGAEPPEVDDPSRRQRIVEAYLAATRSGDFEGLIRILHPDVVLRADQQAVPGGRSVVLHGAESVAQNAVASAGRARHTRVALVDGVPGLVMTSAGRASVILTFEIQGDRITAIDVIADPRALDGLDISDP